MTSAALKTSCLRSLDAAAPLEAELDALNLASRRPSPYNTLRYLRVFEQHDDLERSTYEILFLVARDGDRLVGYLPMRRRREKVGPLAYRRVESMCTHTTDRPQVVARPEDEAACAQAFRLHLLKTERGFSLLEFRQQDEHSPLLSPPGFHDGVWVRHFPSWTNSTIDLPADFESWWRARKAKFRAGVLNHSRRLIDEGDAEYVSCHDPRATLRLLDVFFAAEANSWKARSKIAVYQKANRMALYRAMCDPAVGCAPSVHLLLSKGLVIAALFALEHAGVTHWQEFTYVEAADSIGPGSPLMTLALREAIERGLEQVNFGLGLDYYKERWGAVVTPTWLVQHFRPGAVPFWKAFAGDLRRRIKPGPVAQVFADFNVEKTSVEKSTKPGDGDPRGGVEVLPLLAQLEAEGIAVARLAGAALVEAIPFQTKKEAPPRRREAAGSAPSA